MLDEQADRSLFLAPLPGESQPAPDDEPPAGPAAPLTEVEGGRRRWLAVVVVVALLVAGAAANRRSAEREPPPVEEAGTEQPVRPAPALLAPSLRTVERLGTTLPEPTGTTLVLAASTQVLTFEVDSGTLRTVHVADLDVSGSYPWGSQVLPVGDALLVRGQPPRALLVPRADGGPVAPVGEGFGSGGGLYPSPEPGRVWVTDLRIPALLEVDAAGTASRSVPLLAGATSIVWDGAGFLQSVGGTTFATPEGSGEPVPVADGTAVAADAGTLAVLRCGEDRVACALELVGRATGVVRPVAPPRDAAGYLLEHGAQLSPDGRWLLVVAAGPEGEPDVASGLAIVDVADGSVRAVEPADGGPPATGAFSPSGRWLFLASTASSVSADVAAVDLEGGHRHALASFQVRGGDGLVLEGVVPVAADRGTEGP